MIGLASEDWIMCGTSSNLLELHPETCVCLPAKRHTGGQVIKSILKMWVNLHLASMNRDTFGPQLVS